MDGGMPGQLEKEKYEVKNIYWICSKRWRRRWKETWKIKINENQKCMEKEWREFLSTNDDGSFLCWRTQSYQTLLDFLEWVCLCWLVCKAAAVAVTVVSVQFPGCPLKLNPMSSQIGLQIIPLLPNNDFSQCCELNEPTTTHLIENWIGLDFYFPIRIYSYYEKVIFNNWYKFVNIWTLCKRSEVKKTIGF